MLYLIEILHQTTTRRVFWQYACVVSYRNSTSNHNRPIGDRVEIIVVSYRNSTSNHNIKFNHSVGVALYLIEILHQTTTVKQLVVSLQSCILSKFYIKPQRFGCFDDWCKCCILSKFYIKPQLNRDYGDEANVVSYRNSTSNHNLVAGTISAEGLYLIEILHQTTTSGLILIDKVLLTGCLPL